MFRDICIDAHPYTVRRPRVWERTTSRGCGCQPTENQELGLVKDGVGGKVMHSWESKVGYEECNLRVPTLLGGGPGG